MAAEPSKTFSQPLQTLQGTFRKTLQTAPEPCEIPINPAPFIPFLRNGLKSSPYTPYGPIEIGAPNYHYILGKYHIHMKLTRRHCWAIPPNRCSASRGNGGHWDSAKDLLEVFSICCPASQVFPDCSDSAKDLLEAFSICCPANEVPSSYWDSKKDLLEVFSICCPASQVFPDCSDSAKDLLEVFSICCLANEVPSSYWDSKKDLLEVFSICFPASKVFPDCSDSAKDLLEAFSICCPANEVPSSYWDSKRDLLEVFSICCPASQVFPDCSDSAKDLLEVFSICCPANEVPSSYWDSKKDLLEVFSICCPASQVFPDCSDSAKDLLEVFSICSPANEFRARPHIPSHRTLQQEAQSNSCFPNITGYNMCRLEINVICRHQPLSWAPSVRCLHIHPWRRPSRLLGEMPREAWRDRCFGGPGRKGIRGCERFLAFMADSSRQYQ